jgi:hypothetical protein
MPIRIPTTLAVLLFAAGCSTAPDVDQVPVGTDVQLTRDDGGLIEGTLTAKDEQTVKIDVGRTTRSVQRTAVADIRVVDPAEPPPALPAVARFREYVVPEGTRLAIRLSNAVESGTAKVGEVVHGSLAEAVSIDGAEVLPAGSRIRGEVTGAQASGKVKGRASLTLAFSSIDAHGASYPIGGRVSFTAEATKERDAATIGIPVAGGAAIGAIIGGKKGAAVGAAVGGGAGTARVLTTAGKEVALDAGSVVTVATSSALDVKVPIARP